MFGLKIGQEIEKSKDGFIQEKKIKPEKVSKETKKKIEKAQEKFETIWGNINDYDGTPTSQKEVK